MLTEVPVSGELQLACIQLCSGRDIEANLERVESLLSRAAGQGAELALLPENFACMGVSDADKRSMAESENESQVLKFLKELCLRLGISVIAGGVLLKGSRGGIRNASVAIDSNGRVIAVYDKMHLFDVDLNGECYRESDVVEAGRAPVSFDSGAVRIGMSICYDLRFPELYRHYSAEGCHLLTVPAAFTETTGRVHWQPLLQARAIENQCYVMAAGQSGEHPDGRRTWGHSMIIDPWGKVIAECSAAEGVIIAGLALEKLYRIRCILPSTEHRRVIS